MVWKRSYTILPSVFVGVKLPKGVTASFKWYLQNFMNQNHKVTYDGTAIEPYKNYDSQLFYIYLALILESKNLKQNQ